MSMIRIAALRYGAELWYEANIVGSYTVRARDGKSIEYPKYDLLRTVIRTNEIIKAQHIQEDVLARGKPLPRQPHGVVKQMIPELNVSGQLLEYRDKLALSREYTLLKNESLRLRDGFQKGIPPLHQLAWLRENRGPMSATIEQAVAAAQTSAANGLTFSISAPTSGNALLIAHGHWWTDSGFDDASASTGFTNRQFIRPLSQFQNTINLLDKVATGSEGTSIAVTQNGYSQENSGILLEVSGLTATPYDDSNGDSGTANANVTSQSSGSVTNTVPDAFLFAAFGLECGAAVPSGESYTNSFVQQGAANGVGGSEDHCSRVATKSVSSTGSQSSTASWTNSCQAVGVIGSYEIAATATPPTVEDIGDATEVVRGTAEDIGVDVVFTDGIDPVTCRVSCTESLGDLDCTLNGAATVTATGQGAKPSHDFEVSGTKAEVRNTINTLTYTSTADGIDANVTVQADDGVNPPVSNVFTVTNYYITVDAVDETNLNLALPTLLLKNANVATETLTVKVIDDGAEESERSASVMTTVPIVGNPLLFQEYAMSC